MIAYFVACKQVVICCYGDSSLTHVLLELLTEIFAILNSKIYNYVQNILRKK